MKEVLLLAIVSFLSLSLLSQPIVNIENLRHSGEIGVFKSIGLSLNSSRGNEERDNYKLDLSFAKNNDKYESLITFNNSKRTKDELLEDKSSFLHARFLKKLERSFDVESYIQSSKNPFQSYKKRNLAGVGIRLNSKRDYKFGLSVMREIEESLLGENISTSRLNLYINKKILLSGDNSLATSVFFQPSINDPSADYKASILMALNIPISEKIKIEIKLSSVLDNDPPDISEKSNHSFSTNFRYSF